MSTHVLPGQQPVLHCSVAYVGPLHERPPYFGVGLVHVLDFLFIPPPQLFEQPRSIQADQPP